MVRYLNRSEAMRFIRSDTRAFPAGPCARLCTVATRGLSRQSCHGQRPAQSGPKSNSSLIRPPDRSGSGGGGGGTQHRLTAAVTVAFTVPVTHSVRAGGLAEGLFLARCQNRARTRRSSLTLLSPLRPRPSRRSFRRTALDVADNHVRCSESIPRSGRDSDSDSDASVQAQTTRRRSLTLRVPQSWTLRPRPSGWSSRRTALDLCSLLNPDSARMSRSGPVYALTSGSSSLRLSQVPSRANGMSRTSPSHRPFASGRSPRSLFSAHSSCRGHGCSESGPDWTRRPHSGSPLDSETPSESLVLLLDSLST
jgi:hypothetical protein